MVVRLMARAVDAHTMAQRARRLDEGGGAILLVSVLGAAVSIGAVVLEVGLNKLDKGAYQYGRIVAMILTVGLTWIFVQTVFALHYAHSFYMPGKERTDIDLVTDDFPPDPRAAVEAAVKLPYRAGLYFPGGDRSPDYWDFLHFSIVIGAACQTADIEITSKSLRRLVSLHVITAFIFNAIIIGLTVNISASLF
jgi:uncharacterized membrane protein